MPTDVDRVFVHTCLSWLRLTCAARSHRVYCRVLSVGSAAAAAAAAQATRGKASPATPAEEHHLSLQTYIVGTTQSNTELHRTAVYTTKQVPRHSAAQSGLKVTIRHIHHTEPIAYENLRHQGDREPSEPSSYCDRSRRSSICMCGKSIYGGSGDEWGGGIIACYSGGFMGLRLPRGMVMVAWFRNASH